MRAPVHVNRLQRASASQSGKPFKAAASSSAATNLPSKAIPLSHAFDDPNDQHNDYQSSDESVSKHCTLPRTEARIQNADRISLNHQSWNVCFIWHRIPMIRRPNVITGKG